MTETDIELLVRYREQLAEEAFAEIVRRHLALVFSAALRQVRSPALAEEVAQSVFTDLARQAHRLSADTILSAWLYSVARRTAIDVVRREARRQKREQLATELSTMNADSPDWSQIEPILEEAMDELGETERSAVLLRYFQNKSLREVGEALGTTEEAARKRVSRGVDSLHQFFTRRGITAGAGALTAAVSANAIQAAPVGMSASIAATAMGSLIGSGASVSATAAVSKTLLMTAIQKTIIGATLVAAVGAGIYQATQASRLREENQALREQQSPLADQVRELARQRDEASNQLVAAKEELARSTPAQSTTEVLKLRGKVGTLQNRLSESEAHNNMPGMAKLMSDPTMKEFMQKAMTDKFRTMYGPLFQNLKLQPDQVDSFLQIVSAQASKTLSLMSAGTEDAKQAAASLDQETGGQLKALLGDTGYAHYQQFRTEIPARGALDLLRTQLGNNDLNTEQSARLLEVIKAEPHELTQGLIGAPDRALSGSQPEIDSFMQRVNESNQRILDQASTFLSAQQLTTLNTVLTNAIVARKVQSAAFFPKQ